MTKPKQHPDEPFGFVQIGMVLPKAERDSAVALLRDTFGFQSATPNMLTRDDGAYMFFMPAPATGSAARRSSDPLPPPGEPGTPPS